MIFNQKYWGGKFLNGLWQLHDIYFYKFLSQNLHNDIPIFIKLYSAKALSEGNDPLSIQLVLWH